VLKALIQETPQTRVFNHSIFLLTFEGNPSRLISEIMRLCSSRKSETIVLLNPFDWLFDTEEAGGPRGALAGNEESEDSDCDEASTGRVMHRKSLEYVFPLLSWFQALDSGVRHALILIVEGVIPVQLSRLNIKVEDNFFKEPELQEFPVEVGGVSIRPESRCICAKGGAGTGKSEFLFGLDKMTGNQGVWIYTHEVVHCELGESPRLVRLAFEKASGRKSGLLLLDDADLLLNSSGRIVKEIVEELGDCISEFRSSVRFVFASRSDVDPFIMSKVDQVVFLD
jgi:hypothetical protein